MKNFILLIVISILSSGFAQNGTNLVPNPDYEIWDDTIPRYWHWESGIAVKKESLNVYSGTYSALIILKSTANPTFYPDTIALTPGSLCSLSVYGYDTSSVSHIALGIVWYNNSGAPVAWIYGDSTDNSGWQNLIFSKQTPRNGTKAQLRIRFYDDAGFADSALLIVDKSFLAQYNGPPIISDVTNIPDAPMDDDTVIIKGVITDDYVFVYDSLYFRVNSGSDNKVGRDSLKSDTFFYHITPDYGGNADSIKYFIKAMDDSSATSQSPEQFYIINSSLQELLANPGFEIWLDDTTPSSWNNLSKPDLMIFKDSNTIYAGNYSLRSAPKTTYTGGKDIRQNVKPVVPGQRYYFSCWVYDNTDSTGTRGWLQWRGASGIIKSDSTLYSIKTNIWQQLYVPYPMYAPTGAESLSVNLRVYQDIDDSVYVYFDEVSLTGPTIEISEKIAARGKIPEARLVIYPNPFSEFIVISYSSLVINDQLLLRPRGSQDRGAMTNDLQYPVLRIYDATGRLVKQFNHLSASGGNYQFNEVVWSGDDDFGRQLPAGVYFIRVESNDYRKVEKVIFLR